MTSVIKKSYKNMRVAACSAVSCRVVLIVTCPAVLPVNFHAMRASSDIKCTQYEA